MFIHKTEEVALGIDQDATERYRRDNQIPDSDEFAMIMSRDKGGKSESQRPCPPIYLISMIQIGPDMQAEAVLE